MRGFFINQTPQGVKGEKEVLHMDQPNFDKNGKTGHYIFRRYITRNGVRIYPRKGKAFKFWVED